MNQDQPSSESMEWIQFDFDEYFEFQSCKWIQVEICRISFFSLTKKGEIPYVKLQKRSQKSAFFFSVVALHEILSRFSICIHNNVCSVWFVMSAFFSFFLSCSIYYKSILITCALCHELGSDGEAVGEVAFDDGDGLTSAVKGGLLAGVFGDVECRETGCGLSGILTILIDTIVFLLLCLSSIYFSSEIRK